jgi:hypothetical protein
MDYDDQDIAEDLDEAIEDALADGKDYQPIYGPELPMRAALCVQDVRRLTLFKWRYSLESAGFTTHQAGHLLFLKWLHARRRIV